MKLLHTQRIAGTAFCLAALLASACSTDAAAVKQKYLTLGNQAFDQKHSAEAIIDYR